jgi:sulfur relay (sulfurtransferase) DsrC/TusE family protein
LIFILSRRRKKETNMDKTFIIGKLEEWDQKVNDVITELKYTDLDDLHEVISMLAELERDIFQARLDLKV